MQNITSSGRFSNLCRLVKWLGKSIDTLILGKEVNIHRTFTLANSAPSSSVLTPFPKENLYTSGCSLSKSPLNVYINFVVKTKCSY